MRKLIYRAAVAGMVMLAIGSTANGGSDEKIREITSMTKSRMNTDAMGRGNGNGNGNIGSNNGNNNSGNDNGNDNVASDVGNGNSTDGNDNSVIARRDDAIDLDVLTILRTLDIDLTDVDATVRHRRKRTRTPGPGETRH
jgi:hypothetical protein